jgi:signal transduction histidine kinase
MNKTKGRNDRSGPKDNKRYNRAALDIHDSHIQPLIGVQLGLIALREKLKVGSLKIADIDRLIEMTETEISDLRERANRMRENGAGETSMASGIKRIADRFGKASGIAIEVEIEEDFLIPSSLAADAFQMVGEALSNIRRQTESTHVVIAMQRSDGGLALQIVNTGPGPRPKPFTPRSITERAALVGGRAQVKRRSDGTTVLHIDMPLARNRRSPNDYGRYQGN